MYTARSWLLLLVGLSGCMGPMTFGSVVNVAPNLLGAGAFGGNGESKSTCGGQVKCGRAAERAAAQERARAERDQRLVANEKLLTAQAVDAARAGDCAMVVTIRARLISFGDDDGMGGNFHDVVFLGHHEIVNCLHHQRSSP